MSKKSKRAALDALLSAMIVFEMFIQYTGNVLHEIMGFVFFATIALHLAMSARWMKKTAKAVHLGNLSAKRRVLAVMACLLAVDTVVLGISSAAISGLLESAGFVWAFGPYDFWTSVHAVSSYALCALVVIHLAMHWAFLASAFKVPYDPSRRKAIGVGVHAVTAVGAFALCAVAARQILPQQVIQAVATQDTSSTMLDDVSDIPYNTSGASADNANVESENDNPRGHGHHHDENPSFESDATESESNSTSEALSSPNALEDSSLSNEETSQSSPIAYDSTNSSTSSGTCTLCGKHCSLSSPRCNKPYNAGLI
ncbi:MAG: DUF4405 domain-containing protein [Eggerthellaceae bacterium]|nr:DUF4405 domain-containing protein [Eggerthellaceae bacterium]